MKIIDRVFLGATLLLALFSVAYAAMNPFRVPADADGSRSSQIRVAPSYVDARVLAATTAESHTVPTGAKFVIFSSSCAAFYAEPNATAAEPAADVTDGTGSELNPTAWQLVGVTTIGVISPTTCVITMAFYV